MSLKKFEKNDIFKNTIKTTPNFEYKIYGKNIYLNNSYEPQARLNYLNIPDTSSYYAYKIKSGDEFFRTTTNLQRNVVEFGDAVTLNYSQTASIAVEYLPYSSFITSNRKRIYALRNALEYNQILSPHFSYSSSYGNKENQELTIVSIPSVLFGSKIEKGSVELSFNYSGSLIAKLEDNKLNGELIETTGSAAGNVAGVVLYNYGVIVLTGSWDLNIPSVSATWKNWSAGVSGNGSSLLVNSGSYDLSYNGVNYIQNLMILAHADKGELNHSNNPTYIDYSDRISLSPLTSSDRYFESDVVKIKNITKYPYENYSGSLEKQTYISKIGIYDDQKNLIAIAKLAKPVRKTENRSFTFKLKLDI